MAKRPSRGRKKYTKKNHKESKGPQHKDVRALILYVGVPLLLYSPGEEPRVFLCVYVHFLAKSHP